MTYMLTSDDDGHWYIIPSAREDEWFDWLEAEDADLGGPLPPWVLQVDGPHMVTFSSYLVKA